MRVRRVAAVVGLAVAAMLTAVPSAYAIPGPDSCANPQFDHDGQQGIPIGNTGLCLYTQ